MDPPPPNQHHPRHQEMECDETLESMLECRKGGEQQEKKPKPAEDCLKCPRCDSTNTKFCYYNNYSLTQPRYFCKSCRRYWTKGGTLRNVPVGGGCRKNKRSSSSSKRSQQDPQPINSSPLSYDSDISLAIARLQTQNVAQMGFGIGEVENGFSILGNNHTHNHLQYDVLGGLGNHGLIGGFFENNPHHLSNGYSCGHMEESYLQNGGLSLGFNGGSSDEMGAYNNIVGSGTTQEQMVSGYGGLMAATTTAATTVTTVKQEMCGGNTRESDNRVLMGFPWQFGGGEAAGKLADFEPVKQNWNGFGPSSWHGLLNSPLM